jgi:hypothetical protein
MSTPSERATQRSGQQTPEQTLEEMLQAYAKATAANPDAAKNLREIFDANSGLRKSALKAIEEGDLKAFGIEPVNAGGKGTYDVEMRTIRLPSDLLDRADPTDKTARKDVADLLKEQLKTASMTPQQRLDRILDQYEKAVFDKNKVPQDTQEIDKRIDAFNVSLRESYDKAKPPIAEGDRAFFNKDDATREKYASEVREHLKKAIESSPEQKKNVLEQIENGSIVRFVVLKQGTGSGGSYSDQKKEIAFDPGRIFLAGESTMPTTKAGFEMSLKRHDQFYYEVVGTIGHEVNHAKNRKELQIAEKAFSVEATAILKSEGKVHDYTKPIENLLNSRKTSEAKAHLEHFNSVVKALDKDKRTEADVYNANPERMKMFFNVVENADPKKSATVTLKSEFTQDPPGSMFLSESKNLKAMAVAYFEQPPQDAKLGTRNDLDYRNNIAQYLIREILLKDTEQQAKTGNKAEIQIDMKALKLDHDLIRRDMQFPDNKPRSYYDISDGKKVELQTDKPAPPAITPAETPSKAVSPPAPTPSPPPTTQDSQIPNHNDITNAKHPGNVRLQEAIFAIENSSNIPPGTFTGERLQQTAANLAYASLATEERPGIGGRNEPLSRIDFAVFNKDRSGLVAGEGELGNPAAKLAWLPGTQDNANSLSVTSQRMHDLLQDPQKLALASPDARQSIVQGTAEPEAVGMRR